jgi:hypothetical protein
MALFSGGRDERLLHRRGKARAERGASNRVSLAAMTKRTKQDSPAPLQKKRPSKPKITARILFSHVFIGSLDEELARLAQQGVKARAELQSLVRKRIEAGIWPTDDLGAAAVVLFLLDRRELWTARFLHHWQGTDNRPSRLTMDDGRANFGRPRIR